MKLVNSRGKGKSTIIKKVSNISQGKSITKLKKAPPLTKPPPTPQELSQQANMIEILDNPVVQYLC